MSNQELAAQLTDALTAHHATRRVLEIAIGIGQPHKSTDEIGNHAKCALGRFLQSSQLDAATKSGKPFAVVSRLHAEFHHSAGQVAGLAEQGQKDAAMAALHGDFAAKSDILIRALEKWKAEALR